MTIGFDGSRAFNKDRTGTENYSYQLLLNLSKIDLKNNYLVYLRPGYHPEEKWPDNFKFVTIRFPRFWTQFGLAKQTFQDKLDVLFIPAHTSPLIHRPGLKTVVTVHDLGAEYLPKMHQLKQRLYLKWITNYQLKSATKLIAVSKATKDDLISRVGIDQKKIEVVYEGFNKKLFKPLKSDQLVNTLKQFDIEFGNYFLFVGTIQPRKNLERLIRAFYNVIAIRQLAERQSLSNKEIAASPMAPRNDEVKMVIVGGKGWLSDEIYKLPKKLGIEDRVKFLGRVPDDKLSALYSGAMALTFPSLFEGFGLPILEAQACGTPVITSNISSMPEVAGKGAILVDPYSEEAIVEALVQVESREGKVEGLVKAGFLNIKKFSWEKCANETLKVLTDLKPR